ncbi:hypothetical protein AB0H88_24575 [Nonomuraea sp. NPDC050680]|uniref:hypothetical protein n=1 Tax=Nonomuraea sp. NPDC050680 TaxID=3154630 RepID=UPI0033F6730B
MSLANVLYIILRLLMSSLLIVGVVLTAKAKAEHGRAATLGMFGCLLLLFGELLSIVRLMSQGSLMRAVGINAFSMVLVAIETIATLITAVGVGLLIWAVVARRAPAQLRQTPGWPQPPQPHGWQQPQQPQQPQPQQPEWQPQSPPQPPPSRQPGWQDPERPGWQSPQG